MYSERMVVTIPGVETMDIPVRADIAAQIDSIALARHVSCDGALADLLCDAITAYEDAFLDLPCRFQQSTDPAESEQVPYNGGTSGRIR